jgi:hypothetical protein
LNVVSGVNSGQASTQLNSTQLNSLNMSKKEKIPASSWSGRISEVIKSDPVPAGCVVIVLIGFLIYEPAAALSTFTGVALMGVAFYFYNSRSTTSTSSTKAKTNDGQPNKTSSGSSSIAATLKNVWEVGQSKMGGDATKTNKSHNDKPFGSKYYYAHNNPGATGGYKDGLRMEDFRMNGPRLLSKGGQGVEDTAATSSEETTVAAAAAPKTRILAQDPSITNITKYLWDDPGDFNGIATIRIDALPLKKDKFVDWKDVQVEDITADLPGEGLLLKIMTTDQGKYQLKINKLYGDAAAVKTVSKSKRLLVRIYKKKNAVLAVRDKSNLEAWPQPHRKI